MKLITFLGKGDYKETTYCWNDRAKSTRFIQEALVEWLQPQTTCVLLTQDAQRHSNWANCRLLLEGKTDIQEVEVGIPDGKNEQELWQIFTAIDGVVEEKDTLAFDITHGFRSLPIIALLVIAYLKQIKSVQVAHLLYGAFDSKDERGTPVFELTPFIELLDWLTAAKMFISTGDSRELASLLEKEQNEAWRSHLPNRPRNLKSLASVLKTVSSNLLLSRVPHLAESVQKLHKTLSDKQVQDEIREHALPLVPLMEQVKQAYHPFAQNDLRTQVELIEWYLQREHVVQAMTLAREWIISHRLAEQHKDWRDGEARRQMEDSLNAHAEQEPLWSKVRDLRNDIAHCGFGRAEGQVLKADNISQQAKEVLEHIRQLADELPTGE